MDMSLQFHVYESKSHEFWPLLITYVNIWTIRRFIARNLTIFHQAVCNMPLCQICTVFDDVIVRPSNKPSFYLIVFLLVQRACILLRAQRFVCNAHVPRPSSDSDVACTPQKYGRLNVRHGALASNFVSKAAPNA